MIKIRKKIFLFVGVIFFLIGFSLHQSYNEFKNSGNELFETVLSPTEQMLSDPLSAPSLDPDKYVSDVKKKSGSFLLNFFDFERDIAGAVTCYFAGFIAIIFATKDDINDFFHKSIDFFFGP